jgi:hypothetical protein
MVWPFSSKVNYSDTEERLQPLSLLCSREYLMQSMVDGLDKVLEFCQNSFFTTCIESEQQLKELLGVTRYNRCYGEALMECDKVLSTCVAIENKNKLKTSTTSHDSVFQLMSVLKFVKEAMVERYKSKDVSQQVLRTIIEDRFKKLLILGIYQIGIFGVYVSIDIKDSGMGDSLKRLSKIVAPFGPYHIGVRVSTAVVHYTREGRTDAVDRRLNDHTFVRALEIPLLQMVPSDSVMKYLTENFFGSKYY